MVTRIKSVDVGRLGRISGRRVTKSKGRATERSADSGRKDDVEVSKASRTVLMADSIAHDAPEIRAEVVEPIREAIANGRYKISSLDVADKILRQVLLDRKRSA